MLLKHLQHMQHVQHPLIYFYNIKMNQLQHISKTSKTLEIYICNIGEEKVSQQPRIWASNGTMASDTDLGWDPAAKTYPMTCASGRQVPLRSYPGPRGA
jgi:hypothetical protein